MAKSAPRRLTLTPDLVAQTVRVVVDEGLPPEWPPLREHDLPDLIAKLRRSRPPGPLYVFAYGSLIWNPGFAVAARHRAVALGWHRQFCIDLISWRGTREAPGLMLALQPGGRCVGMALEVADQDADEAIATLVKREIVSSYDLRMARWIALTSASGVVSALVFWAGPKGEGISRGLPLGEVAARLARACGHGGSGAEYLYNTISHLESLGIRDRNLWELQRLVAEEVEGFSG